MAAPLLPCCRPPHPGLFTLPCPRLLVFVWTASFVDVARSGRWQHLMCGLGSVYRVGYFWLQCLIGSWVSPLFPGPMLILEPTLQVVDVVACVVVGLSWRGRPATLAPPASSSGLVSPIEAANQLEGGCVLQGPSRLSAKSSCQFYLHLHASAASVPSSSK